jgi:hypothetical protein
VKNPLPADSVATHTHMKPLSVCVPCRCEVTGEGLPAAMLPYCGRSMLEGQVRDLQAQEYLYWHLTGTQVGGSRKGKGGGGQGAQGVEGWCVCVCVCVCVGWVLYMGGWAKSGTCRPRSISTGTSQAYRWGKGRGVNAEKLDGRGGGASEGPAGSGVPVLAPHRHTGGSVESWDLNMLWTLHT